MYVWCGTWGIHWRCINIFRKTGTETIQIFWNKIEHFKFKNLNYEPAICHCRKKANIILCCIRQSIVYSLRELILPLCSSLEDTQNQMDTVLSNLLSNTCLWAHIWTRGASQLPSCLSWSVIPNRKEVKNTAFDTTVNKYFSANFCCYYSMKEHWCVNAIQWNTQICVTVSTMTQ